MRASSCSEWGKCAAKAGLRLQVPIGTHSISSLDQLRAGGSEPPSPVLLEI